MTEHFVLYDNRFTVALHGPNRGDNRTLPLKYGASPDEVCLIRAASCAGKRGHKEALVHVCGRPDEDDYDVYADVVILTEPGSSAVMFTADCANLVLFEAKSNRLVIAHAGRPAMTPDRCDQDGISNVVSIALQVLTERVTDPEIEACITGSICGDCFLHDRPAAAHLIRPFAKWSHTVLNPETGALHLPVMIKQQLLLAGVDIKDITYDGICTRETPSLASYRRDGSGDRNAVVVVLH